MEATPVDITLPRSLLDNAPVAVYHANTAGNLTYINHEYRRIFGLTPEQSSNDWAQNVHPDDRSRIQNAWEKFCLNPRPTRFDSYRTLNRDGAVRYISEQVVAAEGLPGFVGTITDFTDLFETAQELERVHKQLIAASRQAGMAEVATNVLHNVGNILNSVNISASLVIERVKQSKAPGVSRLAALLHEKGAGLGEFLANDERGKRVPEYLTSLGEQLVNDQKMTLEELASLRDNMEHIKDTVAMQQTYAKLCGVTETVAVVDLVEDSLRLNAGAFVRHGVTLQREFGEVPPITVDKHKVLQILVNLVRNAKYACDESGRPDKLLTLRIGSAPAGVRICVTDNGIGIAAENMPRLFTHGFTTRAAGHGFGLHSAALAAQELGGSLSVESAGLGHGATFTLELPCSPSEAARV